MARRRETGNNEKLSERELAEFREIVARMERAELENYYEACLNACRYNGMRVCSPRSVQEFVQVWRTLHGLKGGRMVWP